jgi:inorganic pyrophosphatase
MSFPKPFYRFRPHPWHGLTVGPNPPTTVHAYIELTTFDSIKYEIDKETGYLRVDRPQRSTAQPPILYGFIPRTYCGKLVGAINDDKMKGDGDPLDICVISERPINRTEIILNARVVGGLQMIDNGKADDKIIAVLENDNIWAETTDISELPHVMIERIRHYFSTYKWVPDNDAPVSVSEPYDHEHAEKVIKASIQDYEEMFGG